MKNACNIRSAVLIENFVIDSAWPVDGVDQVDFLFRFLWTQWHADQASALQSTEVRRQTLCRQVTG